MAGAQETTPATSGTPTASTPPVGGAAVALMVMLGLLTAFGPLSLDMYLPALPEIADDFAVPDAQVQVSITTCLVGLAVGQLFGGPLSDRWGRRRPMIAGTLAYTLACLVCVLAPSAPALAAARLAQGFAGGIGVVVARAVVRDLYAGVDAARYFSRLTLVFGVVPIAAPTLGSAVLAVSSWRGVFVVLAGTGVLLALGTLRWLPESLPADRRSAGGMGALARALAVLARDRVYVGYTVTQGLAFAGLFAYLAGSSFALQDVFGLSTGLYGLAFGVNALGIVLLGQLNVRLLRRFTPRALLRTGLSVAVAGGALLVVAALLGSLAGVLVGLFVAISTIGLVMPNGTALVLDRHPERAGTAAALMGFAQSVIAACAPPLVGLGGEGTPVPMAVIMASCATLSLIAVLTVARPPRPRTPAPATPPLRATPPSRPSG